MSEYEPGAPSQPSAGSDQPQFQTALRGYDRAQVDSFVQDLTTQLAAMRRRVEEAERAAAAAKNAPPPSFEHLGAEAARVLAQAGSSATLLIEEARGRGKAIVEEAEAQATELIKQAEQRAAEIDGEARQTLAEAADARDRILADTEKEAEQLRARVEEETGAALEEARKAAERIRIEAATEQRQLEIETQRLREARDRMRGYVSRIYAGLGELLAEPSDGDPEGQPVHTALADDDLDAESDASGADGAEAAQGQSSANPPRWWVGHNK
jgi:DivIVA domain-containing protein